MSSFGTVTAAVLARNEVRSIGRCLESLTPDAVDRVVVVDTGSDDGTVEIAKAVDPARITVVSVDWSDSFAAARNTAIELIGTGWVVFIDADEWLTPAAASGLRTVLAEAAGRTDIDRTVLCPTIVEHTGGFSRGAPRILRADGGVRFAGAVHEEARIRDGRPAYRVDVDLVFGHDGYRPEVVLSKRKQDRNAALLARCRAEEPANPRWIMFTIRDLLDRLTVDEIDGFCDQLRVLHERSPSPEAATYRSRGLRAYAQRLLFEREHGRLVEVADALDHLLPGNSDTVYYRTVVNLLRGVPVGQRDLVELIHFRQAMPAVEPDALHTAGLHIDALIAALLDFSGQPGRAAKYRAALDGSWTDPVFRANIAMIY